MLNRQIPPTRIISEHPITLSFTFWAGIDSGLSAGKYQQGRRVFESALHAGLDMPDIVRRFALLKLLQRPARVAFGCKEVLRGIDRMASNENEVAQPFPCGI